MTEVCFAKAWSWQPWAYLGSRQCPGGKVGAGGDNEHLVCSRKHTCHDLAFLFLTCRLRQWSYAADPLVPSWLVEQTTYFVWDALRFGLTDVV